LCVLRTARFMQQMSDLFLAAPETAHAAIVAMLAPELPSSGATNS
jgi:hypothetical protein